MIQFLEHQVGNESIIRLVKVPDRSHRSAACRYALVVAMGTEARIGPAQRAERASPRRAENPLTRGFVHGERPSILSSRDMDEHMKEQSDETEATERAEAAFVQAAKCARQELLRANERAESKFYEMLRCAAPGDLRVVTTAQADLNQSIATFGERYREAIANAERARLLATLPAGVETDEEVSHAEMGPLSALVAYLARQRAAALASRLSTGLDAGGHTSSTSAT